MKNIRRYLNIYKGVTIPWLLLAGYVILSMISSHLEVGAATLTASIIDSTKNAVKTQELVEYILSIVGTGLLGLAVTYVSGVAFQKINLGVRVKLWRKIMHLPISANDWDNGSTLITRLTTDADASCQYVDMFIRIFTTVYGFVVTLEKLLAFNEQMTLAFLGLIPFSVGLGIINCKLSFKAGVRSKAAMAGFMGYLAERVRGFRLIKTACTEEKEMALAEDKNRQVMHADIFSQLAALVDGLGSDILAVGSLLISFVYGGYLVNQGVLSLGRVMAFYSLSGMLLHRIMQFLMFFSELSNANGVMLRISQLFSMEDEKIDGKPFDCPDENIILQDVCFGYSQDKPILRNVSCTIPKGQITAIIGPNGAGKSTLFKLLERMYEPTSGVILFGDKDSRSFQLDAWRKAFGIVTQDNMVMSGTVRENICYGVERQITDEELIAVAKKANVYDFILNTPGGFDAEMGVDGRNFSGGQRQCIAIARAMMRNPDYLLLDESTSNLDVKSERIVSDALARLMQGRTTVMIAHNPSAILMADRIIIMKDGSIEAAGTPEELKSNPYYQIFMKRGVLHEC